MESLRPERDEVARFQATRQNKPNELQKSAPPKKPAKPAAVKKSGSPLVGFGLFLAFIAIGAGAWLGYQQHLTIKALETQLSDASNFISQSKLLMARFEGELSETGQELEESGTNAAAKLKFLDSEMRKLWVVSNERNKDWIKQNQDAIDKIQADLSKQNKAVSSNKASADKAISATNSEVESLAKDMSTMVGTVSLTRSEFSEEIALLKDDLTAYDAAVAVSEENKKAIESIDASRRQLIDRIVSLEKKVNDLKLKSASTAPASAPGP